MCLSSLTVRMSARRGRPRKNATDPSLWEPTDEHGQKTTDFIFTMDKEGRPSIQALEATTVAVPPTADSSTGQLDEYMSAQFEDTWVDPPPRAGDEAPDRDMVEDESDPDDEPQKDTGKRKKRASVSVRLDKLSACTDYRA